MNTGIEKDKHLLLMFENFPNTKITQGMQLAFQDACHGVGLDVVSTVCEDFIYGRVEGTNRGFLPTVATFTDHLDRVNSKVLRDRNQSNKELPPPAYRPPTAEQKRRVRMLQATYHATARNTGYRHVVMQNGWPVYEKTGEQVLTDKEKTEKDLWPKERKMA